MAIDARAARHGRVFTMAVGSLFTCDSEYATTDVAMASVKGPCNGHPRLTRRDGGILAEEARHNQCATYTNVRTREGYNDDRRSS